MDTDSMERKVGWAMGCLTIIVVGIVILALASVKIVKAGTVRVVKTWGKVSETHLDPGLHFVKPFADSTEVLNTKKLTYETTSEHKQKGSKADYKDYPVDTNTLDGQQVDIFYTIRFSVDSTKATWIVQNIGSEAAIVEKIVKTESRVWVRNVPREFEANELYTGNIVEVQNKIMEHLEPIFAENGLVLDSVGIREIKFTPEYIQAIEDKQIEAVRVETAKNTAEKAKYEKEALITKAEGQAREQELQRATISDELLQKMWIEAWREGGSQVPHIICGDEAGMFLNMPVE